LCSSGVTEVEKRQLETVQSMQGKRSSSYCRTMAAAIGIGIDVEAAVGNMIIDIGGGTTEIAVIALSVL